MPSRRAFLAGAAATLAVPTSGWAALGDPAYLAAARRDDGTHALHGLSAEGQILFARPLPGRGHAAAAHPTQPKAVAFARRPGVFAVVLNCADGHAEATLEAAPGRHFYGHGVFSRDGATLFTTENDLDTLQGRIGIWDASAGYARVGDIASGGIGPHDIARLPDSDVLVVANGGIATHPDSGREPLNLATMRPNLAYLTAEGGVIETQELDAALRLNSIRHLALRADGLVAAAMQWQGADDAAPPLVLTHRRGEAPRLLSAPDAVHRRMRNYAGSVGFSRDGTRLAITSPRGAQTQVFDTAEGRFLRTSRLPDVCGLAPGAEGFLVTNGQGVVAQLGDRQTVLTRHPGLSWDNHLIALG